MSMYNEEDVEGAYLTVGGMTGDYHPIGDRSLGDTRINRTVILMEGELEIMVGENRAILILREVIVVYLHAG